MLPALQLPAHLLERGEPFSYHDPSRPGFVSLLQATGDGHPPQWSFKLHSLADQLLRVDAGRDCWLGQGEFFKPNRRTVNLWRMPLAFVDLDTYKVPDLAGLPPDWQVERLLLECELVSLPPPTLVVFSGRGLQAKWLFEKPLPRKALPRWHAVQTELCRRLGRLGADKNALDASRVLRLVGTVNSKSKELARVVFEAKTVSMGSSKRADGVVAYDFEVLANEVLPLYREQMQQVQATRDEQRLIWASEKAARDARRGQFTVLDGGRSPDGRKHPNLRSFVPSQLAWDRLGDIRKLAELRGWWEGAPEGERDLPLFLCACFLAQAVIVPKLYPEMEELAREFAPSWTEAQLRSCISSVLSRAKAASRGETVEFKGKHFDPRYRWTNAELLKRLDVSAEEERHLTTIITKEEKGRRAAVRSAERRRADGCLPRSEWLAHREQLRAGARLLRAQGWSIRRIAEELGTSPASVHSYCQD